MQSRTPLELAAQDIRSQLHFSRPGDVFVWGSGANYQLGTGSTENHELPVRLDSFDDEVIVALAAAKFHTAAVSKSGKLYTWGWSREGRLGHPHFEGESRHRMLAQIHPIPVAGLSAHRITSVATAKHHTLACTSEGYVFSWGNNKHGRLGYHASGIVWSPRRVYGIKHEITSISASSKHGAALTTSGKLYTWGDNSWAQLGYKLHGKTHNVNPKTVEVLRDRKLVAVSLFKRHSVVLTEEGDVLVWGFNNGTISRVSVNGARDTARSEKALRKLASLPRSSGPKRAGSAGNVCFHRDSSAVMNPTIVAIAAGGAHTTMLTSTGACLAFPSDDPNTTVQEVQGVLGGKCVVKIAAGRTRTVAVTDTGEVYAWEGVCKTSEVLALSASPSKDSYMPGSAAESAGRQQKSYWIVPHRVQGIRRCVAIAIGDKHSIALQGFWIPRFPDSLDLHVLAQQVASGGEADAAPVAESPAEPSRQRHSRDPWSSAALTPARSGSEGMHGTSPVASSLGSMLGTSPGGMFVQREQAATQLNVRSASGHDVPSVVAQPRSLGESVSSGLVGWGDTSESPRGSPFRRRASSAHADRDREFDRAASLLQPPCVDGDEDVFMCGSNPTCLVT